jgi:hypothetical protein
MSTPQHILDAQAAYRARPYGVQWVDSHCSTHQRFNSLGDAVQYLCDQYTRQRRTVARERYCATDLRRCELQTPTGTIRGDFVVLASDVSSY